MYPLKTPSVSMIKNKLNNNSVRTDSKQINFYRLCQSCGNFSHINENNVFCSVCGNKLIEECPNCKTKIENPTAQYCVKCGERIIKK